MKKKEYYYVDRDGNYHRRTRKAGSHGSRRGLFPWVGMLLAVALLAGTAGVFRYLNHRTVDQTVAAVPAGGEPTTRVEVEASSLKLADGPDAASDASGRDSMLPSVEELFQEEEQTADRPMLLSADAVEGTADAVQPEDDVIVIDFEQVEKDGEDVREGDEADAEPSGDEADTAEPSEDGTEAAEGATSPEADAAGAEAGEEAAADEAAESAPAEAGAGRLVREDPAYLPIAEGVETERKVVAIVIESCGNTGNLKSMLSLLSRQGGAVTLCPAGENLSDRKLVSALQSAAEDGAEIEAMDWSTKYLYQMTDQEMAEAIWNEGQALNEVLGRNYQPHFYRMRDSRGEVDQRAHDYLDQLGYSAVLRGTAASWTMAASSLMECVRPGAVLLFKTGKTELKNLKELLPWLEKEGYALVTLNELFGLPANETAPLAEAEMPQPRAFAPAYRALREGDYGVEVLALQNRLRELGLLKSDKDLTACFAEKTVAAVRAFQKDQGLEQTGEADPETRRRLMGEAEAAPEAGNAAESADGSDGEAAPEAAGAEAEAPDSQSDGANDPAEP